MSNELARVSISLEDSLLEEFDKYLYDRGYNTRSEALRDLIRDRLLAAGCADDRIRVGVLTFMYSQRFPKAALQIIDRTRWSLDMVLHHNQIPIGTDHVLHVMTLRGPVTDLQTLAHELLSIKGVLHGDLRFTGDEIEFEAFTRRQRPELAAAPQEQN